MHRCIFCLFSNFIILFSRKTAVHQSRHGVIGARLRCSKLCTETCAHWRTVHIMFPLILHTGCAAIEVGVHTAKMNSVHRYRCTYRLSTLRTPTQNIGGGKKFGAHNVRLPSVHRERCTQRFVWECRPTPTGVHNAVAGSAALLPTDVRTVATRLSPWRKFFYSKKFRDTIGASTFGVLMPALRHTDAYLSDIISMHSCPKACLGMPFGQGAYLGIQSPKIKFRLLFGKRWISPRVDTQGLWPPDLTSNVSPVYSDIIWSSAT